jgi:hypothetical protein
MACMAAVLLSTICWAVRAPPLVPELLLLLLLELLDPPQPAAIMAATANAATNMMSHLRIETPFFVPKTGHDPS